MTHIEILQTLYWITGGIAVIIYIPIIQSMLRNRDSTDSSILSWGISMFSSVISFGYAVAILKDVPAMAIQAAHMIGATTCFIVLGLKLIRLRK